MAGYQSTYRVQLSRAFPFAAAEAVVPYLADLGVSHLYTSPILRARSGSTHGYDVVDPTQVAPELGEWATFFAAGATVFLSSHILSEVQSVADRLAVLGAILDDEQEAGPVERQPRGPDK